ncbi:unnamed protein product [Spirodela intermedia]|uniref:Uncharacterized protein n=1 Tax=Spirodela intermedia TaxID=51605 RepID=A0A7I8JNQ4_SPIIN|nr:unnamed protein product [Spirodela intermedia]CAA6671401.1 unnamed protein product [Spirodela intermedia]
MHQKHVRMYLLISSPIYHFCIAFQKHLAHQYI